VVERRRIDEGCVKRDLEAAPESFALTAGDIRKLAKAGRKERQ
jgi:hypothetical protein